MAGGVRGSAHSQSGGTEVTWSSVRSSAGGGWVDDVVVVVAVVVADEEQEGRRACVRLRGGGCGETFD